MYVANIGQNALKFSETDTFIKVPDNSTPQSVAVDPSNNDIFVAGFSGITEYNASGPCDLCTPLNPTTAAA